jgi:hypothetical protein
LKWRGGRDKKWSRKKEWKEKGIIGVGRFHPRERNLDNKYARCSVITKARRGEKNDWMREQTIDSGIKYMYIVLLPCDSPKKLKECVLFCDFGYLEGMWQHLMSCRKREK